MNLKSILDNENKYWDKLILQSEQGSIFSSNLQLDFYKNNFKIFKYVFFDENKNFPIACVPILIGDEKPIFNIYNGIIYNHEILSIVNNSKRCSKILGYSEKIINELNKNHENINLTLHPYFEDLRPFQWFNYHEQSKPKFKIELRYTGILNSKELNKNQIIENLRTVRRQEYKKFSNLVTNDGSIDDLINLYKKTFDRQDIKIDKNHIEKISSYCQYAMEKKFARLNFLKNFEGDIVNSSFFVFDNKNAYYLIGASDPKFRNKFPSSPIIVDQILYFNEKKLNIDFIGVNSPQRGDFKLSFSPKIFPYFNLTI